MAKTIKVTCTGADQHVNEIELARILQPVVVTRSATPEKPQAIPARSVFYCKFCWEKAFFVAPMILWLLALYLCITIVMAKKFPVFTNSPSDIRDKTMQLVMQKQNQLQWAFGLLAAGLLVAFALFYRRLNL